MTVSRHIKLGTAERLVNREEGTVLAAIVEVCKRYRGGGFRVKAILGDSEFEHLRGDFALVGINLNTTTRDEHVGEIERYNRTVKDRARAMYNILPFTKIPDCLIIEMVYTAVFWLNTLPATGGVSETLSPREIVLR
jgi:hypothetical protein